MTPKIRMKIWNISYAGNECQPVLIDERHKQPYPQLIFIMDGKKFFVEFENRSDHRMCTSGKRVNIEVISWNRSVRQKGTAVFK